MPKYQVTKSEITNAVSILKSDNTEFRSRVADLVAGQQELASQWQGDANTAFTNAFNNDKGQWDTFAALIDQYAEALENIGKLYETTEATNTSTANTRTY